MIGIRNLVYDDFGKIFIVSIKVSSFIIIYFFEGWVVVCVRKLSSRLVGLL